MNYSITSPHFQFHSPKQTIPPPSKLSTTSKPKTAIKVKSRSLHKDPDEDLINNFIERRNFIIKKMSQISQQAENQQDRITQLRGLIFAKPHIQEAISIQNLLKKTKLDFSEDILQDLTSDIEISLKLLQNLRNFCQFQKFLSQTEKMKQTKLIVESTWQQIYRLSIHDPLLFDQVSTMEWTFKAMEALSQKRVNPSYPYIENCEILKKGAIESQSEEIMQSNLYKIIEEELHKHQLLIEKVKSLGSTEKMDVEEVQNLLHELNEFGFGMKEERESVEEILSRAVKIEQKFQEFLQNRFLASQDDFKELTQQIQNFPLTFLRIEEYLSKIRNEQKEQVKVILKEVVRRIIEENRELHGKLLEYAEETSMNPGIQLPREQIPRVSGEEMEQISKYSAELIEKLHTLTFEDFCTMTQQNTARGYEHIKAELWLAKVRMLQIFCQGIVKPRKTVKFVELRSFLSEVKEYIESLPEPKRAPFDEQMDFLLELVQGIRTWMKEAKEKQEEIGDKFIYGFIDVTKATTKPVEKQRKFLTLQLLVKKLKAMDKAESLNKKRNQIDNSQIEEIEIEKKIKKQNEMYQSPILLD